MKLRRLRAFGLAAEAASFRRAPERLEMQISVVSRTVASLEDEIGVTLFDRHAGGVRLTAVGQAFLVDTRRILADVDRAREAAQSIAAGTVGRLRLAVCEDATTPVFARVLAAFRARLLEVALDLFELPSAMQATALSRGEIDVGLLLPPVQASGIEIDELGAIPGRSRLRRIIQSATVSRSLLRSFHGTTSSPRFPSSAPAATIRRLHCSRRRASHRASSRASSIVRPCSPWSSRGQA